MFSTRASRSTRDLINHFSESKSKNSSFSTIITEGYTSDTEWQIPSGFLLTLQTYYWRVGASDNHGLFGGWSPSRNFSPQPPEASTYHTITIDGDFSDWLEVEKFEYDVNATLYMTWDASYIYFGFDRSDAASDMFIFFDTDDGVTGSSTASNWWAGNCGRYTVVSQRD